MDKEQSYDLKTLRHSASHVMAQAVKRIYPEAKLAIGPAIDEGFYYDFDLDTPITEADMKAIKAEMKKIVKEKTPFEQKMMPRAEAIEYFRKQGEIYKVELIEALPDEEVSIYTNGEFTDLCRGPHVEKTSQIGAFELLSVAGAYWRGDEKNKMLQRIYATAFPTRDELKEFLRVREEARKRDHRKVGKELGLFSLHHDTAGAGLVFWNQNGTRVRTQMEAMLKKLNYRFGYEFVTTPHIAKADLWKTSGHLGFYKDNMFAPLETDGQDYILKPMNCPGHIIIYKEGVHSYRQLPVRMAELGTVYRYERSGVLHGTLRVRGFTQDDAHIFCTPEQIKDEVVDAIDLVYFLMDLFGFKVKVFLSTKPEKAVGSEENWKLATEALEGALKAKEVDYTVDPGEGVFYGPKIDFKMLDVLGREWQGPTIQVDFNLPERFDATYVDKEGKPRRCVMIHRALLGSLERFFGVLIEHYAGLFPLWLAPEQVRVIPVSAEHEEYAARVRNILQSRDVRITVAGSEEKLGKRIRTAETQKVPYVLVVGDKEQEGGQVSVRKKGGEDLGAMALDDFFAMIKPEMDFADSKIDDFFRKKHAMD